LPVVRKGEAPLSLVSRSSIVLVLVIDLIVTREKRRRAKLRLSRGLPGCPAYNVTPHTFSLEFISRRSTQESCVVNLMRRWPHILIPLID
jgi:hypothetical protein